MEPTEQESVTSLQQPEAAAPPQAQPAPEPEAYSAPGSTVFDAERVSCYYGSFRAVTDVSLSIYDNVAYGPRINGEHNKRKLDEIVEHSLRQAALWEEVKDRLKASGLGLSGGQAQRLCIARTLAVEPDVVLMDEPCSALDPIATGAIEDLMRDIKSRYTIVIVTHNMQQATRVSDRTAFYSVLRDEKSDTRTGVLVEYGHTEQICHDQH